MTKRKVIKIRNKFEIRKKRGSLNISICREARVSRGALVKEVAKRKVKKIRNKFYIKKEKRFIENINL